MATDKQKELAKSIKECHKSLRDAYKQHGETAAWQQHIGNKARLEQYAQAMRELAEIWEENSDSETTRAVSRIKWSKNYILKYFDAGVCLAKRARELRQLEAWCVEPASEQLELLTEIPPPQSIRILDVGSCYNPFKDTARFAVTAVDLSPATSEVLPCDFLQVSIEPIETELIMENLMVKKLKAVYFHCVIFSLLLEYLPSSQQRISCCRKAYEALLPEGLLLIITPDSEHVGKNAALMKQWQLTLAQIGFMRVCFEKLPMITCMAFRKSIYKELPQKWAKKHAKEELDMQIKIPQDD